MVKTLQEAEIAVLSHIARYRLTLPEILAQTWIVGEGDIAVAHDVLERLHHAGWLGRGELIPEAPGRLYYHLAPFAARELGHDEELAKPLSRHARIEWFAIATFCCGGEKFRQPFTKEEFRKSFKDIWFPGQPIRYYLEPDGNDSARLAFPKVDSDGPGRWDRLIDSCARFLRQRVNASHVAAEYRARVDSFARLVRRDRFQFSVLTALPEKKRSIEIELERRRAAGQSTPPIRVYVVPGLFDVMFPAPNNSDHR